MSKYEYDTKTTILQFLYTFPYLTARQITTLFSPGSLQRIRGYLHELSVAQANGEAPHVHREKLFSQKQNPEYVYWLSTSGRRHLRSLNKRYDFTGWKKEPWQMGKALSGMEFRHHMTTTDFFLAALGIPDLYPDYTIEETTHYFHIRLPKKTTPVIPDGVLQIRLPDGKLLTILPEIDLDTEPDHIIQDKITSYLPYIESGRFAHEYGISDVPLIVFYTPQERRRDALLLLIEKALLTTYVPAKFSWFRVGCGTLSPELFFEHIWITPSGLEERTATTLVV